MQRYKAALESLSRLAMGRHHGLPKEEREQPEAYDRRTYLARLHTAAGEVFIPPMMFKLGLENTAKYLGMQIPGKGKSTYTKHFRQGVLCTEPVMLGITPAETRMERIFTSLEPQRQNSPRGWRHFPVIDHWKGDLDILVLDEIITADVLRKHLEVCGMINGIGVWRPGNGGLWGKFKVLALEKADI